MNRVYTLVFIVIFLVISTPRVAFAQCNCSASVPATPVTYYNSFPATNASSTTLSFPQFNPAIGTLACLTVNDTASGITTTSALNKDLFDSVEYEFQLLLTSTLHGPAGGGINVSHSYSKTYGPNTLAPLGQAGDTITYGPDVIFSNEIGAASTSTATGPYLGTGTVDFNYSISGGVVTTEGGANYTAGPTTNYWASVSITYYWCPAAALSTTITDFTATPDNGSILLQWLTQNQQPNTQYAIQISQDGKSFYNAGQAESNTSATGTSAEYQYQYNPDPSYVGKLYFRIQQTDPSGKVSISTILVIDPNDTGSGKGAISYQTFPNPATNSLQVQFNTAQTGRFMVQLVATSGQIVQEKAITLTGNSQIRLDLNPQPVRGLYFLRTTDQTHNLNYVTKVFIN